jgi:hypothetical protein
VLAIGKRLWLRSVSDQWLRQSLDAGGRAGVMGHASANRHLAHPHLGHGLIEQLKRNVAKALRASIEWSHGVTSSSGGSATHLSAVDACWTKSTMLDHALRGTKCRADYSPKR